MTLRTFWKQKKCLLLMLLLLGAMLWAARGLLQSQGYAQTEPLPDGLAEDRSQIVLTGIGYEMSYEQEQEVLQQEEKKEVQQAEKLAQVDQQVAAVSPGRDAESKVPGAGPAEPGTPSTDDKPNPQTPASGGDETSKIPNVETDLYEGKTFEGTAMSFSLQAKDYRGHAIGRERFVVTLNGSRLYSSGADPYRSLYSRSVSTAAPVLSDGANVITIQVTDDAGNLFENTYTIYMDTSQEMDYCNQVTLSIDASNLGLGYIVSPTTIRTYDGEKIAHVVSRFLAEQGIAVTSTGTEDYGFYLARIYRPGIMSGFQYHNMPAAVRNGLEDKGLSPGAYNPDSLGEKDLFPGAGWMFSVNEESLESGMASFQAYDGDEIVIWFTTYYGDDYKGVWNY